MKRIFAGAAILGIAAVLTAGCSESTAPAAQTHPVIVQTATPSAPQTQLSDSDQAYLTKLRTEQPQIFSGCPGQGEEKTRSDIKPNLRVVGLVEFVTPSADYPYGAVYYEFDGTKITERLHTERGWENNVTVAWSNTTSIRLYSLLIMDRQINWAQSMQHARGDVNENNFNLLNHQTAVGERWFIMGYNPNDPCAGRQSDLYNQINWVRLFEKQELDLERRQ